MLKMTVFEWLPVGAEFAKFDNPESIHFTKREPIFHEGKFWSNAVDDNTGELVFIESGRLVYVED